MQPINDKVEIEEMDENVLKSKIILLQRPDTKWGALGKVLSVSKEILNNHPLKRGDTIVYDSRAVFETPEAKFVRATDIYCVVEEGTECIPAR